MFRLICSNGIKAFVVMTFATLAICEDHEEDLNKNLQNGYWAYCVESPVVRRN